MPELQKVRERLANVDVNRDTLITPQFSRSLGTPNQRSRIAEFQTNRAIAIRGGRPFELSIVAVETFTTDGTANNTETFSLSNDLIDSDTLADNLVLYENRQRVEPDAVDVGADSFDYTDDATGNDLTAYYAAGDQALVEIQKVAPNGVLEPLWSEDVGLVHRRDQNKDPLTFDFADVFQATVPTDFSVEVYVDAPYTATVVGQDTDNDGNIEPADNAFVEIPIAGTPGSIEGLQAAVRQTMAQR